MSPLLDVAILRARPPVEPANATTPTASTDAQPASLHRDPDRTPGDTPVAALSMTTAGGRARRSPVVHTTRGNGEIDRKATDAIIAALDESRDAQEANTILIARCDDVARRIIREGGHVSKAALARELQIAPATLNRLMNAPIYRQVYDRVRDELFGTIDDQIADERLDILARGDTLQRRAMTVLAECFELTRKHAEAVRNNQVVARPQLLKVGVDAAAEVRQLVTARSAIGQGGATVNINITRNHATVIQGAIAESGIDLSDVLDGIIVAPRPDDDKENRDGHDRS